MKRQEEILSQAVKEQSQLYQPPEWRAGFISGAKWADEHPKEGLVNLKDVCDMNWQPIDRDENGFATEECLDKMFSHLPVVLHHNKMGGGYDVLNPQTESLKLYFREGVKTSKAYTHYLPIPRLKL